MYSSFTRRRLLVHACVVPCATYSRRVSRSRQIRGGRGDLTLVAKVGFKRPLSIVNGRRGDIVFVGVKILVGVLDSSRSISFLVRQRKDKFSTRFVGCPVSMTCPSSSVPTSKTAETSRRFSCSPLLRFGSPCSAPLRGWTKGGRCCVCFHLPPLTCRVGGVSIIFLVPARHCRVRLR